MTGTLTEATRQVLQRYHEELWVKKNTAALAELVHNDFEDDSGTPRTKAGPEYAKEFFDSLFVAFPDLTSHEESLLADGDLAAIRWTLTGTMQGSLWEMPATHKSFKVTGIDIVQVKEGKIIRDWGGIADQLPKIFQQLGAQG